LSSEPSLRAVRCLRALNLKALRAFLLPGPTAEAADSTFSSLYPRSSVPSFPQRPVYALQALRLCHLGDILDHQGLDGLANGGISSWKREVLQRSGSGADGGLVQGWQTEQRPRAGRGVSQRGRVNTKLMDTAPLWEGLASSRARH
ncbi:hypothetical protein D4764_15G0012570, partial [Takifugu flavidus]